MGQTPFRLATPPGDEVRGVIPHEETDRRRQSPCRVPNTQTPPIEVVCEISSLEEPIRGRVHNEAGRSAEFRGWMEFSTALMSIAADTSDVSERGPNEASTGEMVQ